MGANPDFIENIAHKAVEFVNLGNVEQHGSTDLVVRRHKVGRYEVESVNSPRFEKTRKITITLDGNRIFRAVLQPGWEKHPDKITVAFCAKEPMNWRDEFMAMAIFPNQSDGN